ncbi:hypothetical protein OCHUTO_0800 [Orientia chuto str. Dubai]|uniref:Uncharacterized protein n=1 Tax=Orientia chuto str. Dubai TaxID=1359168 RepID=A0A0F3MJD9_9RICK|nr:hypothetical protein [Candidatus Orientia mediorientalis]KJV55567.1 hypothetical protein OCHUTO_0800 [Orientia chuto str. Dubai]
MQRTVYDIITNSCNFTKNNSANNDTIFLPFYWKFYTSRVEGSDWRYMNLPNLTCYVKLAGNFPITKLKMKLQTLNIAFIWAYKLLNKLVN